MARRAETGETVLIDTRTARLEGSLVIPDGAAGIVVFVHGSGSSRHSPRNQAVARELQQGALGTLLFDLLTAEEEAVDRVTRQLRFDIDLLARRTIGAIDWLTGQPRAHGLGLGVFGASTGAAAALIAAAERPVQVRAVVSRGGRPDMAAAALPRVQTPTLLIVGELDAPVIEMNRAAMRRMDTNLPVELRIVPGATHLFEEPGALELVSELARDWFRRHLSAPSR